MNFLRVNAYYDIFTSHFGKIGFPLYRMDKKKPKKFFFTLDEKQTVRNNKDQSNKDVKNNTSSSNLKRRISVQQDKIVEVPELKKKVVNIFSKVLLCILGDIQYRLTSFKEENDDENQIWRKGIKIPSHITNLSYLIPDNNDINFNNSNEDEEDEESKEIEENEMIDNNNNMNNDLVLGSISSRKETGILRGNKKDKRSNKNSDEQSSKKNESKELNSKEEENSFKLGYHENNKNNGSSNINSNNKNTKRDINSISDKASKNKDEKIKKSENSDVTDVTKSQNQVKVQLKLDEKNNSFQDFDDINFDMDDDDDDDDDTHIPKFFTKDKNIIQLNDYPELINDLDNQAIRFDSHNVYQQSDI